MISVVLPLGVGLIRARRMIVENVTTINAPPKAVWKVTRDIENWPRWTLTVTEVTRLDDGPFTLGSTARIKQPGLLESDWRVTEFRDGEAFTWETWSRGMHISATHEIHASGSGTKSVLRLSFKGILAVIFWPSIFRSAKRSLELENTGLKRQCEAA